MIVCLDPGHGQFGNKGVLGYYEGTQMWHLGQYLQAAMRERGWTVKNTRPKITDDPRLDVRGQMARGCDLFLSLHSNAPGSSAVNYSSIRGASIYDSVADKLDYLEVPLVAEIARIMNTPNLGVKHRWNTRSDRQGQDYYGVLRNAVTIAKCPDAMLIEHGYHTNEQDAAWLLSHANLKRLAEAEAEMITRLWKKQADPTFKEEEDMVYCKRGQGSIANPDKDVVELQNAFIRLGVEMKNPSTGTVFKTADGSYGPATAAGVQNFEKKYGMTVTNGEVFTDLHVRVMLAELSKLPASTGVTQSQLDAAKGEADRLRDKQQKIADAINVLKGVV